MRSTQSDPITVVLVDLTGMTGEMVKGILAGAPDIELVGELSMGAIEADDDCLEADVAILGGDEGVLPRHAHELLKVRPQLRVLAVVRGGREGSLYELRPRETPLGGLTSQVLLGAVRTRTVAWA